MLIKTMNIFVVIIVMTIGLFGCESLSPKPLQLTAMVPRNPELVFRSTGKTCSIGEFEGRKEKGEFIHKVTTLDLKQIVAEGLKHSQLFTSVYLTEQKDADYTLTAKILGQPLEGSMSVSVALYVTYRILYNKTGETVFNKRIHSVYKVTTGGMVRIRKANEGAARENIKKFLAELSKVRL